MKYPPDRSSADPGIPARVGLDSPIYALFTHGESLTPRARQEILALGKQATALLVEIVQEQSLWDDQAPGAGFAPIHAAEILGELADPAALQPLVDILFVVDPDALLDDAVVDAIRAYGPVAVPAALDMLSSFEDPKLPRVVDLISQMNFKRDPPSKTALNMVPGTMDLDEIHKKTLQTLLKYSLKVPDHGADYLADFGDPIALDALDVALNRYIARAGGKKIFHRPIFAIANAIKALGGKLSASQLAEIKRLSRSRKRSDTLADRFANPSLFAPADAPDSLADSTTHTPAHPTDTPQSPADSQPVPHSSITHTADRPGRNQPCWCGSGRKYKRCHLDQDQASAPDSSWPNQID